MKYFSHLLDIHGFNDCSQTELHTAERLVTETISSELNSAIEKLKNHISPFIDQIPAVFFIAAYKIIRREFHKLISLE